MGTLKDQGAPGHPHPGARAQAGSHALLKFPKLGLTGKTSIKSSGYIDIPLVMYRMHVVVTWAMTRDEIIRLARRSNVLITREHWGRDFDEHANDSRCNGACMELGDDNCDLLVWLRHRPKRSSEFATLAHELYHAVQGVMRARNLQEEKESPAFLMEYLMDSCQRALWPRRT